MVVSRLSQRLGSIDAVADKPLPTEFRIFRAGENPSDRGGKPFVFDASAAASVMAAYNEGGHKLMMDLAHASTDPSAETLRADATDALCWYDIEVRTGELWAINIEWTPEGERRIRAKLQRYVSPTFTHDDNRCIGELINVALVAMPGFYNATDLAAMKGRASRNDSLSAALRSAIVLAVCGRKAAKKA